MGEIQCFNCGYTTNHLMFHGISFPDNDNNTLDIESVKTCPECNHKLGKYCEHCNEYVCNSCHSVFDHIENLIQDFRTPLANAEYEYILYLVSIEQ